MHVLVSISSNLNTVVPVRNGVFPAVSVHKGWSLEIAATTEGELVSSEGAQEGAAIKLQTLLRMSLKEAQNVKNRKLTPDS